MITLTHLLMKDESLNEFKAVTHFLPHWQREMVVRQYYQVSMTLVAVRNVPFQILFPALSIRFQQILQNFN